jgi:hypothetical protein
MMGGVAVPAGGMGMLGGGPAAGGEGFSFLNEKPKDAFAFVGDELGKNKTKL